jgi:hypothetical protein
MPGTRLFAAAARCQAAGMEPHQPNEIHLTAVDVRGRLIQLDAERAETRETGLADIPSYMADLEEEIEATRQLYVIAAVTEIAELRAELFEAQQG